VVCSEFCSYLHTTDMLLAVTADDRAKFDAVWPKSDGVMRSVWLMTNVLETTQHIHSN